MEGGNGGEALESGHGDRGQLGAAQDAPMTLVDSSGAVQKALGTGLHPCCYAVSRVLSPIRACRASRQCPSHGRCVPTMLR